MKNYKTTKKEYIELIKYEVKKIRDTGISYHELFNHTNLYLKRIFERYNRCRPKLTSRQCYSKLSSTSFPKGLLREIHEFIKRLRIKLDYKNYYLDYLKDYLNNNGYNKNFDTSSICKCLIEKLERFDEYNFDNYKNDIGHINAYVKYLHCNTHYQFKPFFKLILEDMFKYADEIIFCNHKYFIL